MNKLLVIIASIFLIGCVTRTEFVVGTDGQRNEILKEKSDIDYVKAADDKINLEKAEQYNPGTENLYLAWGYYYSTVGDSLKAEKVYKIALDEYDSGSVNTNYGIFLCNEKRFKEANEHFMN